MDSIYCLHEMTLFKSIWDSLFFSLVLCYWSPQEDYIFSTQIYTLLFTKKLIFIALYICLCHTLPANIYLLCSGKFSLLHTILPFSTPLCKLYVLLEASLSINFYEIFIAHYNTWEYFIPAMLKSVTDKFHYCSM